MTKLISLFSILEIPLGLVELVLHDIISANVDPILYPMLISNVMKIIFHMFLGFFEARSDIMLRQVSLWNELITNSFCFMVVNYLLICQFFPVSGSWFTSHRHFCNRSVSSALQCIKRFQFILMLKEKLRKLQFKLLNFIDIIITLIRNIKLWFNLLKLGFLLPVLLLSLLLRLHFDFWNVLFHFTFVLFRSHHFR